MSHSESPNSATACAMYRHIQGGSMSQSLRGRSAVAMYNQKANWSTKSATSHHAAPPIAALNAATPMTVTIAHRREAQLRLYRDSSATGSSIPSSGVTRQRMSPCGGLVHRRVWWALNIGTFGAPSGRAIPLSGGPPAPSAAALRRRDHRMAACGEPPAGTASCRRPPDADVAAADLQGTPP